jgi:cobalt/nickel transport system permease protein
LGDGGILAFVANCFNMAFILPFTGYFVYEQIKKRVSSERGEYLAFAVGSYIGINAAAFCVAVEFVIQPIFFHNAAGQPIYCPYTLSISIFLIYVL